MTLLPWYYRALALAALVAAVWGHGWVSGAGHVEERFETFRGQVATAGSVQIAKHEAVTKQGAAITASVGGEYAKAVADLYARGGVRPRTGSSKAPAVPDTPAGTDARPANVEPGPALVTAGEDECKDLRNAAALTTVQFLYLRDWVEQQASVWAGMTSDSPANSQP